MTSHISQDLYDKILINIPIACVDIVILSQGKVLLVQRNDPPAKDYWWVPGGRVLKGEMMKDAAHRKALEEVGLDCTVGPIIYTAETIFPDGPNNIPVHSINSCFILNQNTGDKPILDNHHLRFKWVSKIEDSFHPYVKSCLLAAGLE